MKTIAMNTLVVVSALILAVAALILYLYKTSEPPYKEMNTFQFASSTAATFNIPGKYHPVMSTDSIITFYLAYPSMGSFHPSSHPDDGLMVRIIFYPSGKMRSVTALNQTQPKGGTLGTIPYFVKQEGDVDIYEKDIGSKGKPPMIHTMYVTKDAAGNPLVFEGHRVYKKYSEQIELDYLVGAELIKNPVVGIKTIDTAVTNLVKKFQVTTN